MRRGIIKGKGDKRFRVAALFLSFSLLLVLMSDIASGEGPNTRVDELSCGNTVVRAYTTCTEDSHDLETAVCTDQHFLFVNKETGASVKLQGSGELVVDRDAKGKKIARYDGLTRSWACLQGRVGFYVYVDVTRREQKGIPITWCELWDAKGRRLATTKGDSDADWRRFYKTWDSKHLPTHPLPDYAFVPVQLFRTDRGEP